MSDGANRDLGSGYPRANFDPTLGTLEEVAPARPTRSWLWATSAVLVIVVAGAAIVTGVVGGGTHFTSSVVVLSGASARTTDSGTARATIAETLTIGDQSETPLRITGEEDFSTKASSTNIMGPSGQTVEIGRTVGGVSYISTPLTGVPLPGDAHWVSITPQDLKLDASAAQSLGSQNPASGLQFMAAIEGNPRVVDRDPVGGVAVTHYAFTLNLQSYLEKFASASSALGLPALGSALKEAESVIDFTKVPAEAWIDSEGRVRRFTMTLEATVQGQTLKVIDDTRFSDFGAPVTVSAPTAGDTVPLRDAPNFFTDVGHAIAQSATTS